jgi:excinuclease UvrABC nuclease subunit
MLNKIAESGKNKGESLMASKSCSSKFEGYWLEKDIDGMPKASGVYCVYACTYYPPPKDTVSNRKLIYIGEAENVNERIAKHEKWKDWRKHLQKGEVLSFSFTPIESAERERVEAALIFNHKPPENSEYTDTFPFDETTISTSGRNKFLDDKFTVQRTASDTA